METPRELIGRARRGDTSALGRLLEPWREPLLRATRRVLRGPIAARLDPADAVQETFLDAYRDFPHFRGDESGLAAWLARIHHNNLTGAIRDHTLAARRAVGRESPHADTDGPCDSGQPTPSSLAAGRESIDRVRAAVRGLPPPQREAVRLRHLEGWSVESIAAHTQRSPSAVAGLLKRGLRSLRRLLTPAGSSSAAL